MSTPAFSLAPHVFFHIGPIPVTDVLFGTLLVTVLLGVAFILASRRFAIVPTRAQVAFEFLTDYIYGQAERGLGVERAKRFLPLFLTMLLFLLVGNQLSLLPFVMQVVNDGVPLFRTPTSTLAGPISFSLSIILMANIMAFAISPTKHILRFLPFHEFLKVRSFGDFGMACIAFFIGVMDIISETAKVISLAARLFGNIFAGEVMIAVIIGLASFTQFLVPLPFLALSVLSGLVQAFVFTLLCIQFLSLNLDAVAPKEA